MAKTPADTCRENGWIVGTRLVGDEGRGPETIEITAIGESRILAKRVLPTEGRETTWTLDVRDWHEVYPLDRQPFVFILGHGGVPERAAVPHSYPDRWKWEPHPGTEQNPERYDLETQRNYDRVREARQEESRRIMGYPEGNTDVPCPHDGEMVNARCWKCGWTR